MRLLSERRSRSLQKAAEGHAGSGASYGRRAGRAISSSGSWPASRAPLGRSCGGNLHCARYNPVGRWMMTGSSYSKPWLEHGADRSVVVVETGLEYHRVSAHNPVDESMFLGDTPGPHVTGSVFQPFGLPASLAWSSQRVVDEEVDAFYQPAVVGLPPLVVFPAGLVENESHSRSSSCTV